MVLKPLVLLVEDEPDDVALTLRAFARSRVEQELVVCRDGAEALDWLFATGAHAARGGALPSLVLLDLKLPRVDGFEVLRRIRADARTRQLPVVLLTSSNEARDVDLGYDLGCNSYVRKPVDFDDLVEAARLLGVYWLGLNEPPRGRAG